MRSYPSCARDCVVFCRNLWAVGLVSQEGTCWRLGSQNICTLSLVGKVYFFSNTLCAGSTIQIRDVVIVDCTGQVPVCVYCVCVACVHKKKIFKPVHEGSPAKSKDGKSATLT